MTLSFDYLALGHVTVDVMEDGSRQAGGTALYSALQASRLGLRTLILTQGRPAEVRELLDPYRSEVEVEVVPADATTTLATRGAGTDRRQRLLEWAGPLSPRPLPRASILHLAPVAREISGPWEGSGAFRGLTAQGLLRSWPGEGGEVSLSKPEPSALTLAAGCDAVVMSEQERPFGAGLIASAGSGGGVVAITAGPRPSTVLLPGGEILQLPVRALAGPVEDLGAGDVYAAALFVALAEGRSPAEAGAFANAAAAVRMLGSGGGVDRQAGSDRGTPADGIRPVGLSRPQVARALSISLASSSGSSSCSAPQARAASSRLPPTGAISTRRDLRLGRVLGDDAASAGRRTPRRPCRRCRSGRPGSSPRRPVLRDHGGDLAAEQRGAPLEQLEGDGVARLGDARRLHRERGDLPLRQGLGVDEAGERLDARLAEERAGRLAEGRLRPGAVPVAQGGADRLDAEPVSGPLVTQQMPPAAGRARCARPAPTPKTLEPVPAIAATPGPAPVAAAQAPTTSLTTIQDSVRRARTWRVTGLGVRAGDGKRPPRRAARPRSRPPSSASSGGRRAGRQQPPPSRPRPRCWDRRDRGAGPPPRGRAPRPASSWHRRRCRAGIVPRRAVPAAGARRAA